MATNRDIVSTRKLNKKNKARLGRGGDTKIREVDGRDSHVNALEAYLIDVNRKAGEDYAKRVGAGTTNPLTGMPEYHDIGKDSYGNTIQHYHDAEDSNRWYSGELPEGKLDYDELRRMQLEGNPEYKAYLKAEFGIDPSSTEYIDRLDKTSLDFIQEEKELTERGLESSRDTALGDFKSQEAAFESQQATLGRTAGRGLGQAAGAASMAASRSGLATSGSITQGYERQKKDLFQDYTAGMSDVARGMSDARRQRDSALESYELGMDTADVTKRKAEYYEKKKQLDDFYLDVANVDQYIN